MFFVVVGTHTEHVINEFALDARINILICQCHTVTNGTDLRRSPQVMLFRSVRRLPPSQAIVNMSLITCHPSLSTSFSPLTEISCPSSVTSTACCGTSRRTWSVLTLIWSDDLVTWRIMENIPRCC